jgi:hypothetical protein
MGSGLDGWIYWCFFTITLSYNQYSAIADLHTSQFTVAHALGFSVSTSRILATNLNTGTITSNQYEVFLSFLLQSPWTADSLNSTQFFISISSLVVLDSVLSIRFLSFNLILAANTLTLYRSRADHKENTSTVAWRGLHRKHLLLPELLPGNEL